jgi:D12 class N6 adenine-specific DNA methyltransferase
VGGSSLRSRQRQVPGRRAPFRLRRERCYTVGLRVIDSSMLLDTPLESTESQGRAFTPALRVRYMGSKHDLAPHVARLVREFRGDRPFLDLFCGMCSVAGSLAPSGRVAWGNDVQWSATVAASCVLATESAPFPLDHIRAILGPGFRRNSARLRCVSGCGSPTGERAESAPGGSSPDMVLEAVAQMSTRATF